MDQERKAGRWIILGVIILALIALGGLAYKHFISPAVQKIQAEEKLAERFKGDALRLGTDWFAGYAVLRSPYYLDLLAQKTIHLVIEDEPDYKKRMEKLASGELHMAVFTIDTELSVGSQLGNFPGTIVLVIDESVGADGIVAYKTAVPNVQALNRPDAKIVLFKDTPNETLARHMISGMLPALTGDSWIVGMENEEQVYKEFLRTPKTALRAFALWEPWLSKALENPDAILIYDTSQATSTVVDVWIVSSAYYKAEPVKVRQTIEAYLQALHHYESQSGGMVQLVIDDGKQSGDNLSEKQARQIVAKIRWKNTMENYAHFGLLNLSESGGLQRLDSMIASIARMLVKTGKISRHPMAGREHELYDDQILSTLKRENFHPGDSVQHDGVRGVKELQALTPEQWNTLLVVGNLDARSIDFLRSQSSLTVQGKRDVEEVAEQLKAWPSYYLTVVGNTRKEGDPEANRVLAKARADTVVEKMIQLGISKNRVRGIASTENQNNPQGQSVTFKLLRQSY
ncbi:MAG: OmpA family protein [Patescibacteria group bacterium]